MSSSPHLPRLLYIGDVPVESSYHGSALLYRLLQDYPPERLRIVEAGLFGSQPERRLKNVPYDARFLPLPRLQFTRFHRWYTTANLLLAAGRAGQFRALAADFKPEAILTVTHGISWITAAAVAQKNKIPLHLICHDEWADAFATANALRNWKHRVFGEIYRAAASRLCVSPFMSEEYERRYDTPGTVLYPSRAADAASFSAPPVRLGKSNGTFTIAYAGQINSQSGAQVLREVAAASAAVNGKLMVFGKLSAEDAKTFDLNQGNIELCGLVKSDELILRLREKADALLVPMSFAAEDRVSAELSFPSKLTDYSVIGVPLLIRGPSYCSAVRWALDNPKVAEVLTSENAGEMNMAIRRLATDAGHRVTLGRKALEVGQRYFNHAPNVQIFNRSIQK